MYFHVYANLVMLSKSNDLVMDMNQHYLELKMYLERVEHNQEIVMDKSYRVFESEERLYENHRLTKCEEKLFETSDSSILYPLLTSGAARMKDKLCAYDWQPKSAAVKKILTKIRPSMTFVNQFWVSTTI